MTTTGSDEFEGHIDLLLEFFTARDFQHGLERDFALALGGLTDRDIKITRFHCRKRVLRRVDTGDDHVLLADTGRFQHLDRAERHLVVISEYDGRLGGRRFPGAVSTQRDETGFATKIAEFLYSNKISRISAWTGLLMRMRGQ